MRPNVPLRPLPEWASPRSRAPGPRRRRWRGVLRPLVALTLMMILCPSPAGAGDLGFIRDASGTITTVNVPGSTETQVWRA